MGRLLRPGGSSLQPGVVLVDHFTAFRGGDRQPHAKGDGGGDDTDVKATVRVKFYLQ
ncbi:protein of unknown function [Methanoculleus bourgensis]|uniref:Uncharacterized protein n=1 Tax=Methanoculleus bourgensis TaxID=83986 RepID=A0A0X3BIB3_9EURY|nr:protein of unknown function [Methanoculleus bourgensis]